MRQLRSVGVGVSKIVARYAPLGIVGPGNVQKLLDALDRYASNVTSWAYAVTARMQLNVGRYDKSAWVKLGQRMGRALGLEIEGAPTGQRLKLSLAEAVELITSLPREAAQRVHQLTLQGMVESTRAAEIAKEIRQTGEVTKSRAMLIARTEVARTASLWTESRAEYVGSEGYIWRTSLDEQVRPSHRKMEGKYIRWDSPPTLSDGTVTHAGQIYNCRCWPEPVLADEPMRGRRAHSAYSRAQL